MNGPTRGRLFLVLLLLPQAGCLNLGRLGGQSEVTTSTSKKEELPPVKSAELALNVAESLHRNGHAREAIMGYETARQQNPSLKLSARLAVLYDQLGVSDKALQEYQKAIQEQPRNANLINNFGYYYYNRGKWGEAEKLFRKALEVDKNNQYAWNNLGNCLAQQHRYEQALEAYQKVNNPGTAHQNLAFHLMTQGKHDQARQVYEKALQMDPNLRLAREALCRYDNPGKKKDGEVAAQERPGPDTPPARPANVGGHSPDPLARPEPEVVADLPDLSPVVVPGPRGADPLPNP